MTITVTSLQPDQWRIFVSDGDTEIYHDTATSKKLALIKIIVWLGDWEHRIGKENSDNTGHTQ